MTQIHDIRVPRTLRVWDTIDPSQLPEFQGRACSLIWAALQEQGVTSPEHAYVRYHSMSESHMEVEVGLPVDDSVTAGESVTVGALHVGPALVHRHEGGHENLGEAYAILAAVDTAGLVRSGAPWEVYEWFTFEQAPNSADWPAQDQWRTLLVQPLSRTAAHDG